MGGVGIAAPQDAIGAVFSNPAAMCFGPFCPTSEIDFAGTLFAPDVSAKITGALGQGPIKADSNDEVYAIPAIGLSVPITDGLSPPDWRFGLQGGAIFKPFSALSLGLNVITPRKLDFKNVADFDNDGFNGLQPKTVQGKTIQSQYYSVLSGDSKAGIKLPCGVVVSRFV